MTSDANANSLIDPQVLMRIKNLEMRARIVVEGFWNGLHRTPWKHVSYGKRQKTRPEALR